MQNAIVMLCLAFCLATSVGAQAPAPRKALSEFASDAELQSFLRDAMVRRASWRDSIVALQERAYDSVHSCTATVDVVSRTAGSSGAVVLTRVVWAHNGSALEGAAVDLGLGIGMITNKDGLAQLTIASTKLPSNDSLRLRVRRIGARPRSVPLEIHAGDSIEVRVSLCQDVLRLEEVVVTGTSGESITNVQHEGVDEGGIVKLHGDHLVTLRRGRLHTVYIGRGGLRPVSVVNAYGPNVDPDGAWYDELLISGDRVVVIGYSYARGGTEIGIFRIDRRGQLHYESTHHLRSFDYYSSRNYAARLIGTKLVFYTPNPLVDDLSHPLRALPAMRTWRERGAQDEFLPIAMARRVYRPAASLGDSSGDITLHTITSCDLAAKDFACDASVVLGPSGRVFYVSPVAVYIWTSGELPRRADNSSNSVVYRMPLDGGTPTALGVAGSPVDQFSFLESNDGHLNVVVQATSSGDGMWNAEVASGQLSLMRVAIDDFGDGTTRAPLSDYRPIASINDGAIVNRFVGNNVLVGSGRGWRNDKTSGQATLHVTSLRGGAVAHLALPHDVDRIEALGSDALVVGGDSTDLHFTAIRLDRTPRPAQRYVLPNAAQGELRSHGFFYRASSATSGILGLPVRSPAAPAYQQLFDESTAIVFVRNTGSRLEPMGQLEPDVSRVHDDKCAASCVDWYGNSRPLFVRGRVFALLGGELVEGQERNGRLRELRRVDLQR